MKEELEKKADKYHFDNVTSEEVFYHSGMSEKVRKAYIDGAKSRDKEVEKLKAQIEKMKCCGNCKHIIDISAKFKYCRIQPDKIFNNNICDKWELAE